MRTERAPRAAVRPTQRPLARALALLLVPVLLSACGGPERVDWPGLRF